MICEDKKTSDNWKKKSQLHIKQSLFITYFEIDLFFTYIRVLS